ncbi:MAG: M24 family metallopeptidase [Candidatus Aenigmatarchaeota archaeon]
MGMIKTKGEIKLLKKSAQIADSCLKVISDSLKENITEKELRRRVYRKIRSQNATLAFQTLVASGTRTSMIHPKPHATDKVIKGIGYIDFGASYKGYKSDVTVPFIKGKISSMEKKILDVTLKAYEVSVNSLRLNQPCWKSFEKANACSKKNGYRLGHSLGHGLGLKIHENPIIVMPRKKKLTRKGRLLWEKIKKINFQKNMVFTIEPGIYAKGLCGCRIENDFLMTDKGPKALTHVRLVEV